VYTVNRNTPYSLIQNIGNYLTKIRKTILSLFLEVNKINMKTLT